MQVVMVTDVFGKWPELETERLRLRKIRPEDAEAFYEYARDPQVSRYTLWQAHPSIEHTRQIISRINEKYARPEIAPWGIAHKDNNRLIGRIGFTEWEAEHYKARLAYDLALLEWSKGYVTEAVRAILAFGFEQMSLNRIEAEVIPNNIGSARVLEKCGFQKEGSQHEVYFERGQFINLDQYAILRREWKPARID